MVETAIRRSLSVPTREWLRALPPASRFVFHGDAAARAAASTVWGVGFSDQACRAMTNGARATLWLGPDEYLLLDSTGASDDTVAAFDTTLGSLPHALVDVGHRQIALTVSGPRAAEILSGACPLDLDIAEFPIDMCTRTVFAKADIVLWRTAAETFHLEVWRSFTDYVCSQLSEIARLCP